MIKSVKYVPKGLSKEDKEKQIKSIKSGTLEDRPKVDYPTRRSQHVVAFEKKYNKKWKFQSFNSSSCVEIRQLYQFKLN